MRAIPKFILNWLIVFAIPIFFMSFSGNDQKSIPSIKDTIIGDSIIFPFEDITNTPTFIQKNSPLFLRTPSNIVNTIKYDSKTGTFIFYKKIGSFNYRNPYYMPFNEYLSYTDKLTTHEYWMERSALETAKGETGLIDRLVNQNLIVPIQGFDKIFGTNTITIKPQGTAELIFGIKTTKIDNPLLAKDQKKQVNFDFDMKIKMGVNGQIGDKMKLGINFDTDATFEFENNVKIAYEGKEDEIIQRIEAGNVTMPLSGSLITGSHSLFGFKTELKFGNLLVTTIFSQQKGESKTIEISGGATTTAFEISADNYDANRHFFIAQYFRDKYDGALKNLPIIRSNIKIRKIEVWITNKSANLENSRNIVAFNDLGENDVHLYSDEFIWNDLEIPSNGTNNLYQLMCSTYSAARNVSQANTVLSGINDFNAGIDYEILQNARLLSSSEYTYNENLGYISLNMQLNNDEVLAVAYEYENTADGNIYKVGEFSTDDIQAPAGLYLKLIKPTILSTELPTWDLMMKNVYTFNAYQVNSQDFKLDIMYRNDKTGSSINYIPAGEITGESLIKVMGLDNLNKNNELGTDGFFDFIDRVTINSSNGRIYFPVVEPFGSYLKEKITGGNSDPELNRIAEQYIFQELYDQTQSQAQQAAEKNKFFLKGEYRSSGGSEINLNAMNIPQGSVKVTAGGAELIENQDYSVDYNLGRVTIINEGYLNSGTPISISLESNSMFNIGTKSLIGTHFDYRISDNFNVGATIMHMHQKPLTTKVSIGNEPISNTIWGTNLDYNKELPFLTRFVDKWIPFIETKAPSNFDFNGEFAHLIPGHPKILSDEGYAHIDDFEGATVKIDLKSPSAWKFSSTPQGQTDLFPEADSSNTLSYNYNRAKLAWYNIFKDFQGTLGNELGYTNDDLSNHYVREIPEQEIFPDRDPENDMPQYINVMNLAYYPNEKGPYNYDVEASPLSMGIDASGNLNNPETRWAGIMRSLTTNNFEEANIEFIEFWLLDPFIKSTNGGGDLYFNLGSVSEDILRDSRQAYENGLPESEEIINVDSTKWGRVPLLPRITDVFTATGEDIRFQDVGLDGLSDVDENSYFEEYIERISTLFPESRALIKAIEDPSNDDFKFYTHPYYDETASILDRHKNFNNLEGNSVAYDEDVAATEFNADMEDLNNDFTMSESESYFQYKIHIAPEGMNIGENYITDIKEDNVKLRNDSVETVKWYHFKIPLEDYEKAIGPIQDFKSIRFVRLFMKNWEQEVILRFAEMDLVRGDWRKYRLSMLEGVENAGGNEITDAQFDISTVNIEENSSKEPVNYILPPGVSREISPNNPYLQQLNEQSLSFKVYELSDGDARAAYKNTSLDVRQFKRLQMFIHAEAIENNFLDDDDLTIFIRLGADYQENYYEYEIPLKLTSPGYYDPDSDNETVWPEENMLDLEFETLQAFKQRRNQKVNEGTLQLTSHYSEFLPESGRTLSIVGSPNLSNVRTIMIGIRNRKKENNPLADDGFKKSVEVWVNELRLAGYNESGGWATRGSIQTNLADFSTLSFAGQYSTPGFGSIEKNVNERQKSTDMNYDFSSTTEFGKFFPQKYGVRVPVYFGYSEIVSNPEYDPLNPDIKMTATLRNLEQKERDEYLKNAQDYQRIKSFNLTNIRINGNNEKKEVTRKEKGENVDNNDKEKERKEGGIKRTESNVKPIWHISNWTLSYGLNETLIRNINTEYNLLKIHSGSLAYNYSITPKNVKPFDKVKLFKYKAFKIIKDFNFYYAPSMISFRTDLRKSYNEIQLRNVANPLDIVNRPDETFDKQFTWNRNYDVNYSLTRNLKLIYSAENQSWIDEPDGKIDKSNREEWESYKREVYDSIFNFPEFGRANDFHQRISGVWSIPIKDLPLLGWTSANASYDVDYYWTRNPIALDEFGDPIDLGNTIRNSQNIRLSGQLNFETLYNKIKRFKEADQKFKSGKKKDIKKFKTVTYTREGVSLKKDSPKSIVHNLKTEDITVKAIDSNGKEIKGKFEVISNMKVRFIPEEDAKDAKITIDGKKEEDAKFLRELTDYTLYTLMTVRNVSLNYTKTGSTILPGFKMTPSFLGMDSVWEAPGWKFLLGVQDTSFVTHLDKSLLATDTLMNTPVSYTSSEMYDFKAVLKPFNGMKIDVDATRREGYTIRQNWSGGEKKGRNEQNGNFMMSFLSIKTAFGKIGEDNTEVYQRFLDNRLEIAKGLAADRERVDYDNTYFPDSLNNPDNQYPYGYKPTSKDVLLESFLVAYAGKNIGEYGRNPFPAIPMPNWRLRYDGLTYYDFMKRFFKKVTIDHAYHSTYTIANYLIDPEFGEGEYDDNYINDSFSQLNDSGYFRSKYNIDGGVMIDEKFAPLLGVDIKWKNDISTKFEYKKTRQVALSFSNNRIIEAANKEFVIGFGYKIPNLEIPLSIQGTQKLFKSDLNIRLDFTYRESNVVIRMIKELDYQESEKSNYYSLRINADYNLDKVTMNVFYNYDMTKVKSIPKTTGTYVGFSLRFNLANL